VARNRPRAAARLSTARPRQCNGPDGAVAGAAGAGDAWWHTSRHPDGVRMYTLLATTVPRSVASPV